MRKIILYIAMSLDGYIADENGEWTGCQVRIPKTKARALIPSLSKVSIQSSWDGRHIIR